MTYSFILTVVLLSSVSCGKSDKNPVGTAESLAGSSWLGTFKPKGGTASTLSTKKVRMNLNANNSFSINLTDQISSSVKGNFTQMPRNKALIFEVEESGSELLGLTGETYDYTYDLGDNELNLSGSHGDYLLMKEGSAGDGSGQKANPLEGDWVCRRKGSASYFVNIASDSFRGRKEESAQRNIYFEGSLENRSESETAKMKLLLTVKSSNAAGIVGNKLIMRQNEGNKAVLVQLKNDQEVPDSLLDCIKG